LIEEDEESFIEQDEKEVSYAPKLNKEQGKIDWTKSALEVTRKVRGMQPWPGAFTVLEGKTLKIKKASIAEPEDKGYPPGTICDEKKFIITAGEGAIQVQELQLEGKKTMQVHEFLRGHSIKRGASLS